MRAVLMDNALEAWAAAIRFCNDIKEGKATLQYQKNFVSALHNAVELIMKQMMLNNNDYKVAEVKKINNEVSAQLALGYFKSTDLNHFFGELSNDDLSKFYTIQFNELISLHKKIFGSSLNEGETLRAELELLQRLRNDETHFLIRQDDFLSEKDFCMLHNFMVRFYQIMEAWSPLQNNCGMYILPYWGEPYEADSIYEFTPEPIEKFSYEMAVRNSKLAKDIAELLKSDYSYGAPDFSPYSIAKDLVECCTGLLAQFDEIWTIVHMMQSLNIITVEDIFLEEEVRFYGMMSVMM